MTKDISTKIPISSFAIALVTALITLLAAGGGAYFLGYLKPKTPSEILRSPAKESERERKIAYWRAPMNPTEIYDKPGKSAMGMELEPVYEDELAGSKSGGPSGRKIAYWRSPMNPTEIYDKPGKSAMGMDLAPVYEDELVGGVEVSIDPVTRQNMGLRKAMVNEESLVRTIRTYGHVTADETRTAQISLKTSGWIEKLFVDFTGMYVEKGQPMFEIYSPELLAAQEELLSALTGPRGGFTRGGRDLVDSARQRIRYFDIVDSEIQKIERSGKVSKTLIIRSPLTGYVIWKKVEAGSYVKAGVTILRIADLTRIWVEAHIYEFELPWVKEGQQAEMALSYQPGRVFSGRVAYVYPYLQPKTRDVVIRLEFDNPDLLLKPDMYADIRIRTTTGEKGLVIPSEAVIRSGERNVVFVEREENRFTPRDVTLGQAIDGGKVRVLTGLAPGETVVTSGQFLLDSESKLKEAVQKMLEAKRAKGKPEKPVAEVEKEEDFFKDLETEEDFFKDMETEEDFFKDMEKDEDFFKDMETDS